MEGIGRIGKEEWKIGRKVKNGDVNGSKREGDARDGKRRRRYRK